MKKVLIIFGILLLIGGAGIFGAYTWYDNAIKTPTSDNSAAEVFEILPGESTEDIKKNLFSKGFITNELAFEIYLKLNSELGGKIQAGVFDLKRSYTIPELLVVLQKARNKEDIKVTIPEGLRYDEIAVIFENAFKDKNPNFSKDEFLKIVEEPWNYEFNEGVSKWLAGGNKPEKKNLEGFLYPDTYYFDKETDALSVIEKLITELFSRIPVEDRNAVTDGRYPKYSFYQKLIIASIIEREAATEEEMPQIADVLYKRLEYGVEGVKLLQVCPSVLYFVKDWKADVAKYWHVDNPYNTYKYPGLPPTPISNPGIKAIKAAIYPTSNEYYFYMHGNDGVIRYGKNLAEHNDNIRKYL